MPASAAMDCQQPSAAKTARTRRPSLLGELPGRLETGSRRPQKRVFYQRAGMDARAPAA